MRLRMAVLLLVFVSGCSSNKVPRPEDITKYSGNYIDKFTYDQLPTAARDGIDALALKSGQFPSELKYSVRYSTSGVLVWQGVETSQIKEDSHGLLRVVEDREINGFLSQKTYRLSLMGLLGLDYQTYRPGYREFSYNARVVKLSFLEKDPLKGLRFVSEHGSRTQIADYWKFEMDCVNEGEPRDASTINSNLQGKAYDFKCTGYAVGKQPTSISRVTYVPSINYFIARETKDVGGTSVYTLDSISVVHGER